MMTDEQYQQMITEQGNAMLRGIDAACDQFGDVDINAKLGVGLRMLAIVMAEANGRLTLDDLIELVREQVPELLKTLLEMAHGKPS